MGCDMVVALGRATADGSTLFGHNSNRQPDEGQALVRQPGRHFAPGESVRTPNLAIPQVRQTHTVLAQQPAGMWGYQHGVNEHGVAVGVTAIRTKLWCDTPGLSGPDLVRLTLERGATACQALDVLTDLITRLGQGVFPGEPGASATGGSADQHDSAFLVTDGGEAYVLEACGAHWAVQRVGSVRAVSDVCQLRQDWDRLSRGLADLAIACGWWPEDGSKLDFAGAIAHEAGDNPAAMRRWGQATLRLEQQNGQIDTAFLRRLLGELSDAIAEPQDSKEEGEPGALATGGRAVSGIKRQDGLTTAASFLVQLAAAPGQLPVAWCAIGPPAWCVYFPLFLESELPAPFRGEGTGGCPLWRQVKRLRDAAVRDPALAAVLREGLVGLQESFDQATREFLAEREVLRDGGALPELQRLAESLMQHNLERFEGFYGTLREEVRVRRAVSVAP